MVSYWYPTSVYSQEQQVVAAAGHHRGVVSLSLRHQHPSLFLSPVNWHLMAFRKSNRRGVVVGVPHDILLGGPFTGAHLMISLFLLQHHDRKGRSSNSCGGDVSKP